MKKLIVFITFVLTTGTTVRAQNDAGQPGHLPFSHTHSTSCGSSGGVCYGYAMGKAAGATLGSGIYYNCDPATIIKEGCPGDWQSWSVDGAYWDRTDDANLNVTGDIIVNFGGHVSFCSMNPSADSILLYHIRYQGQSPTTDYMHKQVGGGWKLVMPGSGIYFAQGYYTLKTFNVTAQNLFYNGSSTVTDHGQITIAGASDTSPVTAYSKVWNASYTATASDNQDYPTGYKQKFNADVGWTQSGSGKGTTLQIPIEVKPGQQAYQANFYRTAGVTFTPVGGGGITVDGETRYTSYTTYVKINPPPADQAHGTAVNVTVDRIIHHFAYWTNSADSDTTYDYSISFYPSAAVTYTAHFTPKPLPPDNVWAGGTVGDNVHVTWTEHPSENVTQYQIWRRVKDNGVLGDPELLTTVSHSTTSYIDYDFLITSGYTDDIVYYDVRSVFVMGGSTQYSDPSYTNGVFATNQEKIARLNDGGAELGQQAELGQPGQYSVSSYPNPFNPSTTLSYQLPQDAVVRLDVYDLIGRRVRSLVDENKSVGYYRVVWNGRDETGRDVASGVYLYRFSATPTDGSMAVVRSGKLVLMR